jgi:hypothetical protein
MGASDRTVLELEHGTVLRAFKETRTPLLEPTKRRLVNGEHITLGAIIVNDNRNLTDRKSVV